MECISANNYYDKKLKEARLKNLNDYKKFRFKKVDITNMKDLNEIFRQFDPTKVVNLAAQAGVRNSLTNPHEYVSSNISGFLNILELCKKFETRGLIYA